MRKYYVECSMCGRLSKVSRQSFSNILNNTPDGANCQTKSRPIEFQHTNKHRGYVTRKGFASCSYHPAYGGWEKTASPHDPAKRYLTLVVEVETNKVGPKDSEKIMRRHWILWTPVMALNGKEFMVVDWPAEGSMLVDSPEERSGHGLPRK